VRRRIQDLSDTSHSTPDEVSDDMLLARVKTAQYRWDFQKIFYFLQLSVLERPEMWRPLSICVYYTVKAPWKPGSCATFCSTPVKITSFSTVLCIFFMWLGLGRIS